MTFTNQERSRFTILSHKSNRNIIETFAKQKGVSTELVYEFFKLGWDTSLAKLLWEAEAEWWKLSIANHQKFLEVVHTMIQFIRENENAENFLPPEGLTNKPRVINETINGN